ncbi:GNAT family N-acetyltransferase [Stagnihabitans tardus]|uniref:GNAT family N-acetyltransferase n=1 Tax=Stagnihabitans tardus TaxID=2699202 RepID=A0AAE4YBG8_9RHOB|nr:GNAT family N-acetyltransferase [Stagnihabitans tardus]NBZ88178.1 GNAT family N-acetyltransferase [Stagnihabitans tardus]
MTDVTFRDLHGMAELQEAEALQRAVWGEGDQPDPADLMLAIQAAGGLVGGAFVQGRLMGYVFGFPTREATVQYSHRLAVLPQARGLGLGVRLKLYQRGWCLARGIARVRWTFDPLRVVNATLNIDRLGAEAGVYLRDYYGEMAGINRGLGSDRLLADWELASPGVSARLGGQAPAVASEPLALPLPEDIAALAAQDPDQAAALRQALRAALEAAFASGRRIVGFDRSARVYHLSL